MVDVFYLQVSEYKNYLKSFCDLDDEMPPLIQSKPLISIQL